MAKLMISLLNEEAKHRIHEQTLQYLEKRGFRITHQSMLDRLKLAGADADDHTGEVRLPRQLTSELLSLAPKQALMQGINGNILDASGENSYYTSLVLDPFIVDWDEGVRPPNLSDVKRNVKIGESLDEISILMRMQYPVTDISEPDGLLKTMEVLLTHTAKHISVYPTSIENLLEWLDAEEVIRGVYTPEAPLMSVAAAVTSPLTIHGVNIEIMEQAIQRNMPVISTVCPMAGTTSPYSIAGTFLQANIEALFPVVLAQLIRPGHPVFYGSGPSVTDMRNGSDLYYRCEKMLFKVMSGEMGAFYGLPTSGEAGGSLTHRYDMQNGAESMLYLLASHGISQHIIGGFGSMGNANGMSSEQIIMQVGLMHMAQYLTKETDLSDESLSLNSLIRTGPEGNFLTDELTLKNLYHPDEFFTSRYLDLAGEPESSCSMAEIAHQKVQDIEKNYTSPVPDRLTEALKRHFHGLYRDKGVSAL